MYVYVQASPKKKVLQITTQIHLANRLKIYGTELTNKNSICDDIRSTPNSRNSYHNFAQITSLPVC